MKEFMRFVPALVLLIALGRIPAAWPADDLLAATFARMDAAAAGFKGLTADLKKTSHTEFLGENDTDSGTMAVKRSRGHELRALVDITAPDKKVVELNGHNAQMYFPKSNTVQILNLDKKTSAMVDQLLLLGFGSTAADIQSAYTVKLGGAETIDGQKTVRLVLTPKKREALEDVVNIELWISDTTGMAVRQKFNERGGDYVLVVYSNMKSAPNLPDSSVKLNVPKDAHREPILR
jgi:outer membrane lipoprotein-sorting protein